MDHIFIKMVFTLIPFGLLLTTPALAGEHPGKEHAGEAAKEHAESQAPLFTASQIKEAMKRHIDQAIKKNGGVFIIRDNRTNKELKLQFVKIHDPVRVIEGKGYFACTDFQVAGEKDKLYDLDFWLNPKDGGLAVTETKIHKEPQWQGGKWAKKERYTFIKDKPVEVP